MTRGEPRPVHITLIATCRVYNSVVVIRRITPGPSPGYETTADRVIDVLSARGTWREVCRAPQPAAKHITCSCISHVRVLNEKCGMGYGERSGRVGRTSRQESNEGPKEKTESKPAGVLAEYSPGTHRDSPGTHRVLTGYSHAGLFRGCAASVRMALKRSREPSLTPRERSGTPGYSRVLGRSALREQNETGTIVIRCDIAL